MTSGCRARVDGNPRAIHPWGRPAELPDDLTEREFDTL
jgi:hypothetical protein